MKKVVYEYQGKTWVLNPVENCGLSLEQIIEKDVPANAPYVVVDEEQIPQDRTFREAWAFSEEGVAVDLEKAKEIWKNKWREARKPKLATLDIEFMKAVESGDTTKQSQIASQKQALRDVTLTPIDAETPEEIKAVWPEILK